MSSNNNTINKLNENKDLIKDSMNELKKVLIEEKRCISYTYVSRKFRVHVKQAIEILDQLVAEERKNGNNLCLNYLLSGNNDNIDNDNEIKMERFMIVKESDMDSAIDWFKNGFNKHIYSIGLNEDSDEIDLNFNEYEIDVKTKDDLKDLQNLTYVQNPNIEFRNTRRRLAVKPTVPTIEDKVEDKKSNSNVKNESKSQSKTKPITKGKKAKSISNMFSKNKKVVKEEEIEDKECVDIKENDDPFGSDSEEDVTKTEVIQQFDESDEEVVEKKETKVENEKKRNSKNSLEISEDEEEIISSKKRSKKYKRVRLISDSDSDEPQESAIDKFVTSKTSTNNSKPIKKIEERQETHVDEDGYVVTKIVKKEVQINNELDSKPNESKDKNKSKDKPKSKQNTNKNLDKKVENKKTKTITDKKGMTQSSITSFFKPKPVST